MDNKNNVVQFDLINDMLDDDPDYVKKFCEAGVISFDRFKNEFTESMRSKNLEELKKTGHRTKPVAQMIGANQLVDKYEKAKNLLKDDASKQQIQDSIKEVRQLCDKIISEFDKKITPTP